MSNMRDETTDRKAEHLDIAGAEPVESQKTTLLEEVQLLHRSLPELNIGDIDLETEAFGKKLKAPLFISGMTGGTERAGSINRSLAKIAQSLGIGFGVGSQRAMLETPQLVETYRVRSVAPDIPLLGNIGATQLLETSPDTIAELADRIDADGLCIHLNPAQELIQPEGDRQFRGCLEAINELIESTEIPIIAKETGCGISPKTLNTLVDAGIKWVDVSGAGGTSWTGIESIRAENRSREVGEIFWNWGIPTAASISICSEVPVRVIGSGGIRNGLQAAKAIALGADFVSMGLPWFRALFNDSEDKATEFGKTTVRSLKTACLLTGAENLDALQQTDYVVGQNLKQWLDQLAKD